MDEVDPATANTVASLAVLAGIAAADALTCLATGTRSRGADHHAATDLLRQVQPGGPKLAQDLGRLLSVKDACQYSDAFLSHAKALAALAQARRLVDAAVEALRR